VISADDYYQTPDATIARIRRALNQRAA
jgi:hypothetical protein